jgi:N-acetylglucosamine repressor
MGGTIAGGVATDDARAHALSATTGAPAPARKALPNLLRRLNERTVFELVRRRGPTSRADLKRHMGVSAPTVSKAVAHLLDAGFLEEVGTAPVGGAGRPVVVYRLARGRAQVLGATIGVRSCTVVAAGLDGKIDDAATLSFPTPKTYAALIAALADAARQRMPRRDVTTLGLGVSAPGEIDARSQRVLLSPNLRMLDGQSPGHDLGQKLGIEVTLVHDTVGSGLAEQHYGVARDVTDFVRIGVLEAFGVSVVSGGRLVAGRRGLAGELGHVTVDLDGAPCGCGNRGCLETVATDAAFARAVSRRLGRKLEIEDVLRLARGGEVDVRPELDRTLAYLAVGVAAAVNLFNPEAVLVCSRMFDADPAAFDRLTEMTAARALRPLMDDCRILRTDANAPLGAVASIISHLTNSLGPLVG